MANTLSFTNFNITDANIYGGISYAIDINPDDELTVGNVASAEITFETDVNTVKLFSKNADAGKFVWTEDGVRKGEFFVTEIYKHQGMYTVTAYDRIATLTDKASSLNITFPITLSALIGKVTTYMGCNLVGTLKNSTLQVTSMVDTMSIRELLADALAYSGCSAILDSNSNLKLIYYPSSGVTVTSADYKTVEAADYSCAPIDNVQILNREADVIGRYGSGTNTLYVQTNLTVSANNTTALNIYNAVKDIVYTPLTAELFDDNGIKVGESAVFGTDTTLIMSLSSSVNGVVMSSVGADNRSDANKETIESISARASEALSEAIEAIETAEEAQETANGIAAIAQRAQQSADEASSSASTALSKANEAASAASSAQQSANTAQTAANQAVADAATANTAANNAGRAAAVAQAAAEAAQGDIDDLETYFWHDAQGAHVLGDTYRTDVKDGLKVVKNSDGKPIASLEADSVKLCGEKCVINGEAIGGRDTMLLTNLTPTASEDRTISITPNNDVDLEDSSKIESRTVDGVESSNVMVSYGKMVPPYSNFKMARVRTSTQGDVVRVEINAADKILIDSDGDLQLSSGENKDVLINGDKAITQATLSGLFVVETYSEHSSKSVGTSGANTSYNISKSGYKPLGVVGFYVSNANVLVRACYLTNVQNGSATINYYMRSVSGTNTVTQTTRVLWVKI